MRNSENKVILTCGVSGSGKTYYSRKLQEKGYFRLSLDEYIWDIYGDAFTTFSQEKRGAIFMEASKEMERRLGELIDSGRKVAFDSTMCKRFKRDAVRKICRERGVEPLFIYFDTPFPTLLKRLSERKGSGANDQIVTEEEVTRFYNNFERPGADETDIVLYSDIQDIGY